MVSILSAMPTIAPIVSQRYRASLAEENIAEALECLAQLRAPITAFFDTVMVMAEDLRVRNNRLALLLQISNACKQFADFQKLVWSSTD